MDLKKLRQLIKIVAESDVAEVEFDEDGTKVTIRKDVPTVTVQPSAYYPLPQAYYPPPPSGSPPPQPAGQQGHAADFSPAASESIAESGGPSGAQAEASGSAETPPATAGNQVVVKAPIVGTYYQASSPGADPYVTVGSKVTPGMVLCIIEAMKLMNEIESEVTGTVKEILVKDAEPVEYDQPLFLIETA